ncbi:E3 ubiquitin-protein ligase UBR2 isoform X3 [Ictalurus punctatus]|uniref:E3 ubiquitin-protein ligase n=1 Tax=Ictalurus punctatus TaxID=7998 RepID=A0A9F7TGY2_ICTPU|nr:E3 ubiquitin-protein ligase UBR2 isoform X3 [Ictalurus punctatus]
MSREDPRPFLAISCPSSCDSALVCVGPRRWRARGGERRQMEMCILCHEAQEILPDGTTMVLAAFVQRSTVMSKNRKRPPHNPESCDPLFMHPDLSFGTHTGSCGHIMHSHCWQRSLNINDANREEKYNSHFFHKACVEPWLMDHRTCPMYVCHPQIPQSRGEVCA